MNEKEVGEIRRRFRQDKNNITHVVGCYVNDKGEVVSRFDQSISRMPQEEADNLLGMLKKTLSGGLGRNLIDISFDTRQVAESSDEHNLLMALRESGLKDENALATFFQRTIDSVRVEGTYLILLAHDTYDVPYRSGDGMRQEDASSQVYSYFVCAICPVKTTKPGLSYDVPENLFRNRTEDWLVSPPELGFLFPAFDDRSANIYEALYYTRNIEDSQQEFVDAIFRRELPMPAAAQKETFQELLAETLSEDCSYDVLQAVHGHLRGMIEEHKENKEEAPLTVTKSTMKVMLEQSGVAPEHVEEFGEKYEERFGPEMGINPKNLVDTGKLEVTVPDIKIQINPERSDLLETRVIDGKRYILIRAGGGVEVNGVAVRILEGEEE